MENIASKEYNKKPDELFQALIDAVQEAGLKISKIEKPIRRMEVSTGVSLFSFGESCEIIVSDSNGKSLVYVRAKPKIAWNITAQLDGKVKKVFQILNNKFI